MLAVVVLQTKPERVQVIVPEKCIYGLDEVQAQLKTWGVNNQHQHVIFWKRDFLDDNIPPNITDQPDFSLPIRDDFPLPTNIDAACYYGRVKRFFSSFDEAKNYRKKFRSILPVVYNMVVLQHQPTPLLPPPNNDNADQKLVLPPVQLDDSDLLALENLFNANSSETELNNSNEIEVRENDETNFNIPGTSESTIDRNALNNSSEPSSIEQSAGQKTIEVTTSTDVDTNESSIGNDGIECRKDANESDVVSAQPTEKTSCSNASIETRSNAKVPLPSTSNQTANSETLVTEVLEDDIEITYVLGKVIKPKIEEAPLKVKANDLLSGNLPFQEYDQGDRSYIVAVQGGLKEVKLKGKAVNFLLRLNKEQRNDAELDLSFIKTMVICVFTCKSVRSGVTLEPELISFIKDLFVIRVENDETRLGSFNGMLLSALKEIRQ